MWVGVCSAGTFTRRSHRCCGSLRRGGFPSAFRTIVLKRIFVDYACRLHAHQVTIRGYTECKTTAEVVIVTAGEFPAHRSFFKQR